MNDTLNNELAQVCNNLFCVIRQIECHPKFIDDKKMYTIYCELDEQYHTLFKLIYGDK